MGHAINFIYLFYIFLGFSQTQLNEKKKRKVEFQIIPLKKVNIFVG